MTTTYHAPSGAPCWVETLQPDPPAAAAFYGALFGWTFDDPGPMPGGLPGRYLTARLGGRLVAGVGQAPDTAPAALWTTYLRVAALGPALDAVADAGGGVLAGPLDSATDGRLAIVTDPGGVALGLWEPGARAGAEIRDVPGAWTMSALHAPDPERAAAFYGEVFGWAVEPLADSPLALCRVRGDERAVAVLAAAGGGVPPHWAVAFAVEDVDATVESALALGATVVAPPADGPGVRSAAIADPQGGVVAVSAPLPG